MRFVQKPRKLLSDTAIGFINAGRMKPAQINARWDHLHTFWVIIIVFCVLFLDLLVGAGHHDICGPQYDLFGFNTGTDVVLFFQHGLLDAFGA